MRPKLFRYSLFVALLAMVSFSGCDFRHDRSKQLVMATDYSYYPFEYYNVVGKPEGFDLDFAKLLARQMGKELVLQTIPFPDQPQALDEGKIDILLNGMTITPERQTLFDMVPYHQNPVDHYDLAFYKSVPPSIHSIEDFEGRPEYTIATQAGTLKADYLASLPDISYSTAKTTQQLLRMLSHKQVTALLLEPKEAVYIASRNSRFLLLQVPLPPEKRTEMLGIALKKGNTELKEHMEQAIAALRASGELPRLEQAWFSPSMR